MNRSIVEAELNRVLASPKFRKSQCHSEFLRFAVERLLSARTVEEAEIGIHVYRRGDDYNPREDAIVRVEASRLRARLREYYDESGNAASLRFELPRGAVAPQIVWEGMQTMAENEKGIWRWTGMLVALLGLMILAGVAWKTFN